MWSVGYVFVLVLNICIVAYHPSAANTMLILLWCTRCLFAELFTLNFSSPALFQGQAELDQLDIIFKLVGSPTGDTEVRTTGRPYRMPVVMVVLLSAMHM